MGQIADVPYLPMFTTFLGEIKKSQWFKCTYKIHPVMFSKGIKRQKTKNKEHVAEDTHKPERSKILPAYKELAGIP